MCSITTNSMKHLCLFYRLALEKKSFNMEIVYSYIIKQRVSKTIRLKYLQNKGKPSLRHREDVLLICISYKPINYNYATRHHIEHSAAESLSTSSI